jgi:hypothetical protein
MHRTKNTIGLLSLLAALFAAPAGARADDDGHHISLTISPLHLVLPVAEFTVEGRIVDSIGLAGILGLGSVTGEYDDGTTETFFAYELGGQFRYYLLGDFDHGMQIGLEALFVGVDTEIESVQAIGNGLAVGPFIGYKIAIDAGFTFDAQLGIQYLAIKAEASDASGTSATASEKRVIPLLNLNLGWSF